EARSPGRRGQGRAVQSRYNLLARPGSSLSNGNAHCLRAESEINLCSIGSGSRTDLGFGEDFPLPGLPRTDPLMLVEASLRARRFGSIRTSMLGLAILSAITCTAEVPQPTDTAEQAVINPPLPSNLNLVL